MSQKIHREIHFASSLLIAAAIPLFPRVLPLFVLLMALNWLVSGIYLTTFPRLLREGWRIRILGFAGLYLLYLLGMAWSENQDYGWFDLEIKLSLLIFPLIFATSDPGVFHARRVKILLFTFLGACVAGSLLFLGRAWTISRQGTVDAFYYSQLSWYFHASYLSMYYTFGTGLALAYLARGFNRLPRLQLAGLAMLALFLEAMIFLLSSKAGLLTLFLTEILFLVILLVNKVKIWKVLAAACVLAGVGMVYSQAFPFAFNRISRARQVITSAEARTSGPEDGTAVRMDIWRISAGLIRQHPWIGTGTGDVKDVLMESYRQNNQAPLSRKQLNAHNQYLQTFLALGLPGILVLLATLGIPAYGSFRRRHYLLFLLMLVVAVNLTAESMFETQAGVLFYAFFNALLFSMYAQDPPGDPLPVGFSQG